MGETYVNMFGGSPLNRLSWLRPSHAFLNHIASHDSTRWILFNDGLPLVATLPPNPPNIAYLSSKDVLDLLGREEPLFGQGEKPNDVIPTLPNAEDKGHSHKDSPLDAARIRGARVVFLGLQEESPAPGGNPRPSSDFKDAQTATSNLAGTTPYFAFDVSQLETEWTQDKMDGLSQSSSLVKQGVKLKWVEPRSLISHLDLFTGGILAEAKSMVDWNQRNKYCPGCGSHTYSMWGGWKIACSSLLPWNKTPAGGKPCPTAKGLHNFTHPRTDAVVIMIALDDTGDRVLLGRNRRFPGRFYSALAGFIEPGESFEDAVKREMWEEAGVKVWDVKYHSGQPWPYPSTLMVGFYARADASQPIRLDLDNELADARWFTRAEVKAILDHPEGTNITGRENKQLAAAAGEKERPATSDQQDVVETAPAVLAPPPFKVPPTSAIAGVLIREWVEGRIVVLPTAQTATGPNL